MKELRLYIFRLFFIVCSTLMMVSCNEKKQFDGYLYPIRENGLYGYIDSVGNRIIEPEFLWVSTFHNGLAMAVVDTIYREVPDSMAYEVGERDTIINVYRMYAKYGYIDKSGDFVIEPRFISYVNMPEKGYVAKDMDDCSNALFRHSFRNRRAMYCDTTTWKDGYIDTKGNVVIEPIFIYSKPFSHGRAVVKELIAEPVIYDDLCLNPSKLRCSYIDTLGNPKTQNKYESLTRFNGRRGIGSFTEIFKDSAGNKQGYTVHNDIVDGDGNLIKDLGIWNCFCDYSRDGISVAKQVMHFQVYDGMFDSYSFVDEEGDYLQPLKGLTENQIDSLNKCDDILEVLPEDAPIADATYFNNGFAGITPDCKRWFVVDKYLIIHGYGKESVFDGFRAFDNGLAAVKRNGKWGFINRKIKEQIPCKYDSCGVVYPYLEEVFEYDIQGEVKKKAYINRKDSLVWESPLYKSEKIENRYSIKEIKDYGKWKYEYNPLNKHLLYLFIGIVVVLLIAICVIWKSVSHNSSKGENLKEIVIQNEPENEVVTDSNLSNVNDDDIDEILTFPTVGQYTEIIKESAKAPDEYFDKLKHLRPVLDGNGEPIMSSGNFAVVFKMKDVFGKQYAVRCFHRAQQGRERNYKLICEELAKVSSPYLSPIRYYDKELFVESDEYPVLLMDWVEGITLDKYIRKVIDDKKALSQLATNFKNLAIWLLNQPFAHGDLKPDNILVKNDGSLVLVDYDGMFVPAMQGQKAREIGSPDFRNPSRTEDDFNKDLDIFPITSVLLSLELLVENKDYLSQYGAEDRLLFSAEDYLNISNSTIYKYAYSSENDYISNLAVMMKRQVDGIDLEKDHVLTLLDGDKLKHSNYKIDLLSRIVVAVILPLFLFIFPLYLRSWYNLHIIVISLIMVTIIIAVHALIAVLDILRPDKKSHLDIFEDDVSGCLGYVAIVPLLLMGDFFSDWINGFEIPFISNIPYYNGEWYTTCFVWISAIILLKISTQALNYMLELRLRLLMTRKEKEIIRIKHEKKQIRKKLAESRIHSIQKRYRKKPFIDYNFDYFDNSNLDDLPF